MAGHQVARGTQKEAGQIPGHASCGLSDSYSGHDSGECCCSPRLYWQDATGHAQSARAKRAAPLGMSRGCNPGTAFPARDNRERIVSVTQLLGKASRMLRVSNSFVNTAIGGSTR